jgi:hypothetical protein
MAKKEFPIFAKNEVMNFLGELILDITSESVSAIIMPPIKKAKIKAKNGSCITFLIFFNCFNII